MEVWIIDDIELFLTDQQYYGYVVFEDVSAGDINTLTRITRENNKSILLKPTMGE